MEVHIVSAYDSASDMIPIDYKSTYNVDKSQLY